jgi:hypothetical protein
MCHEMSQYTPTITQAAAKTAVYACQSVDVATTRADGGAGANVRPGSRVIAS